MFFGGAWIAPPVKVEVRQHVLSALASGLLDSGAVADCCCKYRRRLTGRFDLMSTGASRSPDYGVSGMGVLPYPLSWLPPPLVMFLRVVFPDDDHDQFPYSCILPQLELNRAFLNGVVSPITRPRPRRKPQSGLHTPCPSSYIYCNDSSAYGYTNHSFHLSTSQYSVYSTPYSMTDHHHAFREPIIRRKSSASFPSPLRFFDPFLRPPRAFRLLPPSPSSLLSPQELSL